MSTPASSPPQTPVDRQAAPSLPEPSTPPNPPTAIRLTLPTPSSFGAHRRSQSINSPASVVDSSRRETPKRGHTRTVSFNQDVQVKPMSPESNTAGRPLYRIPQRSSMDSAVDDHDGPPLSLRQPPSALKLRPTQTFDRASGSPSTGPKSAPIASRFASTAAARGLSIAPTLDKLKEKRAKGQGITGRDSIWSAGLTSTGGWITPGLASARSTTSATTALTRQRGLSVAVIKDGKEMLVDSGPITPGLPGSRRQSMNALKPENSLATSSPQTTSPQSSSASRPKEVILCRYYHTPGLTCTSRPCRFVHNLATLPISPSVDPAKLRMLSPTKSPDCTMGTFAQAQDEAIARSKTVEVKDSGIDVSEAQPGETVVLSGENGKEMTGMVFYMSGGGKGPAGKSKAKFKTVACRDYLSGYCPYGESCSFIHEQPKADGEKDAPQAKDRQVAGRTKDESETISATQQPAQSPSAWSRGPPKCGAKPSRLSAFAAPYSCNNLVVNPAGEVKEASLVPPPPSLIAAAKFKSAWSQGRPRLHDASHVRSKKPSPVLPLLTAEEKVQEVEMPIPTPTHAHLMPPVSAWTVTSTDTDPATPWDPAIAASQSQPIGDAASSEVWGETHSNHWIPSPSTDYQPESTQHAQPLGSTGILWTPDGWMVQDTAMKTALTRVEHGRRAHRARQGIKDYYRKRPCKFYAQGDCPHGDHCTYLHVLPTAHQTPDASVAVDSARSRSPTLPCKFYNSQAGCQNGDSCKFLHTLVIPDVATSVQKPRPWRTRPCRHFQLARCHLGHACYFAHVVDPNFVSPKGYEPTANTTGQLCRSGVCELGEHCRYVHYRDPSSNASDDVVEDHSQTEGRLEALKRLAKADTVRDDSEDEDEDDIQIITTEVAAV